MKKKNKERIGKSVKLTKLLNYTHHMIGNLVPLIKINLNS